MSREHFSPTAHHDLPPTGEPSHDDSENDVPDEIGDIPQPEQPTPPWYNPQRQWKDPRPVRTIKSPTRSQTRTVNFV